LNANDPFWSEEAEPTQVPSDIPEAVKSAQASLVGSAEQTKPDVKRMADGSVDMNAAAAATIREHEERGAQYYKQQYEMLEREFNSVNRYQGLIQRLESDPNLVDVLERHIAGEVLQARQSIFDDSDDDDAPAVNPSKKTAADMSPQQLREQARREGEMQGAAQAELRAFLAQLQTNGVPEYLQHKFTAFTANPNGLTVGDMYAAFLSMEERVAAKERIAAAPAPKREGPSAVTVSAIGGSTDRPSTEQNIRQSTNGVRYVENANDPVAR
jgi:hypothetical protein